MIGAQLAALISAGAEPASWGCAAAPGPRRRSSVRRGLRSVCGVRALRAAQAQGGPGGVPGDAAAADGLVGRRRRRSAQPGSRHSRAGGGRPGGRRAAAPRAVARDVEGWHGVRSASRGCACTLLQLLNRTQPAPALTRTGTHAHAPSRARALSPFPFFLRPPNLCMHANSLLQARRRPCGPKPTGAPARPARDAAPALPLLPATNARRPAEQGAGRSASAPAPELPAAVQHPQCLPEQWRGMHSRWQQCRKRCGAELPGGRGQKALELQRVVGRRRCTGHRTEYAGGRGYLGWGGGRRDPRLTLTKSRAAKSRAPRAVHPCTRRSAGHRLWPERPASLPSDEPLPRLPLSQSGAPRRTGGMRASPGVLQRQPGWSARGAGCTVQAGRRHPGWARAQKGVEGRSPPHAWHRMTCSGSAWSGQGRARREGRLGGRAGEWGGSAR